MAAIHIIVTGMTPSSSGNNLIVGHCRVAPNSEVIGWEVSVPFTALATVINEAIRDAAIAQAELAGYSVTGLDKKTIFGQAGGL